MTKQTDAELDEKLARLGARVADRGERTRRELEQAGFLEAAELLRTTFQARLTYLKTERIELGTDLPQGQPYNFDLKGHAHVAANAIRGRTESPTQRPGNQPYRGKPDNGKRRRGKTGAGRARGSAPMAWQHSGRDRATGED